MKVYNIKYKISLETIFINYLHKYNLNVNDQEAFKICLYYLFQLQLMYYKKLDFKFVGLELLIYSEKCCNCVVSRITPGMRNINIRYI